jgi:hypothetical protein
MCLEFRPTQCLNCVRIRNGVSELRQQLLYTLLDEARKAVQGEANRFIVRGVHRSVAKTLDGLHSEGYSGGKLTWRLIPKKTVRAHARQYVSNSVSGASQPRASPQRGR